MPRSRARNHNRFSNARVAPRYQDFDDRWLQQFSERQYARFVDLTRIEDRRRFHPNRLRGLPGGPAPLGFQSRPRVVVVPEGHLLARLAPYGGRVPLARAIALEQRTRRRSLEYPTQKDYLDAYGGKYSAYTGDHLSRRVGFQHPWQVMICIRRKQRKEVMFAIGRAGRGGGFQKKPRRNFWSEVRC